MPEVIVDTVYVLNHLDIVHRVIPDNLDYYDEGYEIRAGVNEIDIVWTAYPSNQWTTLLNELWFAVSGPGEAEYV